MSWHGLEGHDLWVERFRRALAQGRLAHAFLFVGPEGIGKRRFALLLAKSLFCERTPPERLDPCGTCRSCVLVEAGTHPDLFVVAKPEDKSEFPVELLIGDREHRGQEGACRAIALKPVLASRRILVIDDADYLNPESANALLKTIEEPPPGAVIILIATSAARQLPTIRSRCQIIQFRPLPEESIVNKLVELGYARSAAEAKPLAEVAGGSIGRAIALAQLDVLPLRRELVAGLEGLPSTFASLLERLVDFAEGGGSSAEAKTRVRLLFEWAAEYLSLLMRGEKAPAHQPAPGKSGRGTHIAAKTPATHSVWTTSPEHTLTALEITLGLADCIERNVNRACLLQAWLHRLADLASQAAGSKGVSAAGG